MTWKYLRKVNSCSILDHRLTPEVRAMLAAMASRMPAGGIEARYREVVEAVAASLESTESFDTHMQEGDLRLDWAEDRLTQYPLHPKVREFFDKFVGAYGHSSIQEATGSPTVYVEGVSPFTAYLSFDSPLVVGQEFSTRAVRHRDWPMCREAHLELEALHRSWLEVFEAEVKAWKVELQKPCPSCGGRGHYADEEGCNNDCASCNGSGAKYPFIEDPQAFRPALDRARWALPSTIQTGFCHTANTRVMGRVIEQGKAFSSEPSQVWQDIQDAYEKALPGMAGMWLKEAVVGKERQLPGHLKIGFVSPGPEVDVRATWPTSTWSSLIEQAKDAYRRKPRGYLDPMWNQLVQVHITFQCSWAVARDWHRHRTAFPWSLDIVRGKHVDIERAAKRGVDNGLWFDDGLSIHRTYRATSQETAKQATALLHQSTELFDKFREAGDREKAMLCLPFGTLVSMRTTMGLRDAVYMLELRRYAIGASPEYKAQAAEALRQLGEQLGAELSEVVFPGAVGGTP